MWPLYGIERWPQKLGFLCTNVTSNKNFVLFPSLHLEQIFVTSFDALVQLLK